MLTYLTAGGHQPIDRPKAVLFSCCAQAFRLTRSGAGTASCGFALDAAMSWEQATVTIFPAGGNDSASGLVGSGLDLLASAGGPVGGASDTDGIAPV